MREIGLCLTLLAALPGCFFANASSTKRLNDVVNQMNRSTRWGQVADAARLVEPNYRPLFIASHRGWGQVIQVADSEVVQIEMAPDYESAIAIVSYDWYLPDALTLHETVVRQRWSKLGSNYTLVSEAIVQGDARLFAAKSPPRVFTADDQTLGVVD